MNPGAAKRRTGRTAQRRNAALKIPQNRLTSVE
jgi:hypothetical protein